MADRVEVRNAADRSQVARAGRRERDQEDRRITAIRAVLLTPAGREMFWNLLATAGVFRSVWESSARIHYNAGRQDFGHEVMADLMKADEELYDLMTREARARMKRLATDTDAAHTAPASATTEDRDDDSSSSRSV